MVGSIAVRGSSASISADKGSALEHLKELEVPGNSVERGGYLCAIENFRNRWEQGGRLCCLLEGIESVVSSERQLRKQRFKGNSQRSSVNLHQTELPRRHTVLEACVVRDTHSPVQHASIGDH